VTYFSSADRRSLPGGQALGSLTEGDFFGEACCPCSSSLRGRSRRTNDFLLFLTLGFPQIGLLFDTARTATVRSTSTPPCRSLAVLVVSGAHGCSPPSLGQCELLVLRRKDFESAIERYPKVSLRRSSTSLSSLPLLLPCCFRSSHQFQEIARIRQVAEQRRYAHLSIARRFLLLVIWPRQSRQAGLLWSPFERGRCSKREAAAECH
jgi:hypothetical protein